MANRLPISPPEISGLTYTSPLGSGGFADVFLYRQSIPQRQVAVKVFLKKFDSSSVFAADFIREANALAKLGAHPNILNIWDANISRNGNPYISMEYCPSSLGKNWRTQPMSLEQVLDIGVQIACALETAHRAKLIHRDIKPSNILINEFGTPVLADFGIATDVNSQISDQVAMSLPWSAPEIVNMQTSGSVATDVFSLGATLYSLLAGRTPFEVDDSKQNGPEKLKSRIAKGIYTPIPRGGIPRIVEEVLIKAMYKEPHLRHGSMQELAMHLNEVQSQLAFNVTNLSIPVTRVTDTTPRYECGHPMISMEGLDRGVKVETGSKRRGGAQTETLDTSKCPICNQAPQVIRNRKKINPLVLIIVAAIAVGFIATAGYLAVNGGF